MWAAKSLSGISHVQPLWSCPSVELAISSHSGLVLPQPKPGPQVYLGLSLVPSGELKDVFFLFSFFCFFNSNWWDLNLRSLDSQSSALTTRPHSHTHNTHMNTHYEHIIHIYILQSSTHNTHMNTFVMQSSLHTS